MLHHLRTGEPMREWEWQNTAGDWVESTRHLWDNTLKYRRKPRTVTYWHCVVDYVDKIKNNWILGSSIDDDELLAMIRSHKVKYPDAKFSPITETTVELED